MGVKLQGLIRRRGRARSGATALEFALLAPIFFVIMFAIIEAGAVYIGESWLQFATTDVGRRLRTGEVTLGASGNTTPTQFRQLICTRTAPFLPCDANLVIDVRSYNNFSAANLNSPITGGVFSLTPTFDSGNPCDVVVVRAFYKWTLQTPGFSSFLVNLAPSQRLLAAAAAMRNEPYNSSVSGC